MSDDDTEKEGNSDAKLTGDPVIDRCMPGAGRLPPDVKVEMLIEIKAVMLEYVEEKAEGEAGEPDDSPNNG